MEIKTKHYQLKNILITPYLSNVINDLKTQGEWKIQITMEINIFSSKDSNETHTLQTKKDTIEIMNRNKTDETNEKLFYSFLQKYQKGVE